MSVTAIRGKTECPRGVSVSWRFGFDSHRLHYENAGKSTGPSHLPFSERDQAVSFGPLVPVNLPSRCCAGRARGPSPFADQARTELSS